MADAIAAIDRQRDTIPAKATAGIKLASEHSFEATFERRVSHLRTVALRERGAA
jgi:hypothetical protein